MLNKTSAFKRERCKGGKNSTERIMVLAGANTYGSENDWKGDKTMVLQISEKSVYSL